MKQSKKEQGTRIMNLIPILDRLIVKQNGKYENAKIGIIVTVPINNDFPSRIIPDTTILYTTGVEFENEGIVYAIVALSDILAVKE